MFAASIVLPRVALAAAALLVSPARVSFSDPIAVYARVERVVMEPNATDPKTIQIWGVFSLATGGGGNNYLPAERGYVYYTVNPEDKVTTLNEWRDIATVAKGKQLIGYGSRYKSMGSRVRPARERPTSPDVYPIGFGLAKLVNTSWGTSPSVETELLAVPEPTMPVDGGRVPAGAIKLTTRNIADTTVTYYFEIEGPSGQKEASPMIKAGKGETSWTPALKAVAGQTYKWRVFATRTGWRSQPAHAEFTAGS